MGVLFTFVVVGAVALIGMCVCAVVESMHAKADAQVERRVAQRATCHMRRSTDAYYSTHGHDAWPVYKEGKKG